MRALSTTLILGTSLLLSSSLANAGSRGFKSAIKSVPNSSIRLDVALSEDLASRANAFPHGGSTCSITRSNRSNGFACDGHLGQRDLDGLVKKIEKQTARSLAKKDITVTDDAGLTLKLTLVDAKNNRPTQSQIGQQVTLSFQSIRLGGAEFEGELFAADGTSLGKMSYSYYEDFLDDFSSGNGTWTDANRAIQLFSKKIAKDFAKHRKIDS